MELLTSTEQTTHIKNILKPWTKESLTKCWDWCSPMLDEESLKNLYKCMGSYCSFNTNNTSEMLSHLHAHEDSVDILKCAYCVATFKEIHELIAHIKIEHGQCRYQCSYCFYRSLDSANVFNHQKIYHIEERCAEKSIMELPEHHEIPRLEYMNAAVKGKVRQKVLKCTVCNEQYLAISSYIQHIKLVHLGTPVACCWCRKEIIKDNAAVHLLTHYIGTYECLYCDYACNIKQMMQRHLGNVHATKPMFCSKRREVADAQFPKKKYLLDVRDLVPAEYVKSVNDNSKTTVIVNEMSSNPKTGVIADEAPDNDIKVPKILNVQGGIKVTDNGVILTAKQTLPNESGCTKLSFSNEEVTIGHTSSVKRTADSTTIGTVKRARLDPAVLKLYENTNVTLTKTCNPIQTDFITLSTSSNLPNTGDVGEKQRSIKTNLPKSSEHPTDSGSVKYNAMSFKASGMVANSDKNEKKCADFIEQAMASAESVSFSNRYSEREKKENPVSFRLAEFLSYIDTYYRQLSLCLSKKKITPLDINVCGIGACNHRFENHDALLQHMKTRHGVLTIETPLSIVCSHCALQLNTVTNYMYHLSVHSLNQYACFLCCYNHFLLPTVATHMNVEHGCNSVQLSFAHPVRRDLLSDIIIVMPAAITRDEKQKYIQETITRGEQLLRKTSLANQTFERSIPVHNSATMNAEVNMSYPKQSHYSLLYKCGMCQTVETSKLSFQKHLIEDCPNKKRNFYSCAHCRKIYKNWTKNPEKIFEHLYYHGENLYGCGSCPYYHYLFEKVVMHIKTASHPPKCEINVLRESTDQWECNVCQLKSSFRQTVMEHMQNVHDLPGERFMCSMCHFRTLTKEESIKHFKQNHSNQDVVMIEMYHETEIENSTNNEDTDSDASSDVQIIDDVIDSYSISSSSDHSEDEEDMQREFEKGASNDQKLLPSCPVLKDHSYFKIESNEEAVHVNVKVKIENCTSTTYAISNPCAVKNALTENNQPSIGNSVGAAVENTSPASSEANVVLNNIAVQEDGIVATEEELEQNLSPTTVMNALSMERRASKRVAVKKDVTYRWNDCTKYGCIFCDNSFEHYKSLHLHSRIVHGTISQNFLYDPNTDTSPITGSFTGFRLFSVARCFYCDKQDTCSALRMHHDKKHDGKTFICLDYWNAFKCGLCAYLNGSGNEKEFSNHFLQFHTNDLTNVSPFDHIDDTFIQWALSLGKKLNVANNETVKIIKYICGTCSEKCEDELSMGLHVATHIVKFDCDYCSANFKQLSVLYEHILIVHRKEDYVPQPTLPILSDQVILEVQMCFINGFILSKREAQFTSHGSLQVLEEGYQKYYEDQIRALDSFKILLSMPISASSMVEDNVSCKSFLVNQKTYPVLKILPMDVKTLEDAL
ncbi:uncharacterized protein LOC128297259 [Anopheles moucheti]|uniref:uncharacterized protein LOC128297259 n=1 Tax=Anopheles moucheti TaxID=186751 RepID=UPI0022F01927|nr:uncharacterized protein LOC128297259 [Anopheles moucheti]